MQNKKRTKRLFLIFLFCCPAFLSFGQASIGLYQVTLNSKFAGDSPPLAVSKPGLGFGFGANVEFKLTEDVFLAFEPGYIFERGKIQFADTTGNRMNQVIEYKDSIGLNQGSFILPVLFRVVSNNQRFHVTGGLELGFLATLMTEVDEIKTDIKDEINDFNISANFGIGFHIPVGQTFARIDLRYIQGLTNIANNLDATDATLPRVKVQSFRLLLGWDFPLPKKE